MTHGITAWGCINWHNMATANVQLPGGDVFNVGRMESGKTTWLDAVQLVLTAGYEMEWNSAANPTMKRTELHEKGRGLRGVLYRENDGQPLNDPKSPAISYFLIQLSDGADKLTLGVGAYASSYQSRVEPWWILAPGKGINEVKCLDEGGRPLSLDDFREANGHIAYRHGKDYRIRVANLLFASLGGSDDADRHERSVMLMEQWQRFLNSAKSYGRLRGHRESELIRKALRAPDETALEKARSTIDEITRLQATIREAEAQAAALEAISQLVIKVAQLRLQEAEQNLGEAHIRHRQNTAAGQEVAAAAEVARQAAERLQQQAQQLEQAARNTQDTLDALNQSAAGQRAQLAAQLQRDLLKAKAAVEAAFAVVGRRQQEQQTAATALDRAINVLAGAVRNVVARLDVLTQRAPSPARSALGRIEDTVQRNDFEAVQAALQESSTALSEVEQGHRDQAAIASQNAERAKVEAEVAEKALENLLSRKQPLADEALTQALDGLEGKVIVLHQGLEIRGGHDVEASLLEQYLGTGTLAAVIPLNEGETELVRRRVHAKAPHIKVVERSELRDGPLNGVLACLEGNRSHPLAVQYLVAAYGDVALLEPGEDRDDRSRVVWRDGNVYDAIAWTLGSPKLGGRFIGQEAMKETLRLQVDAQRTVLVEARKRFKAATTAADKHRDEANAMKQLRIDISAAVNPTHLMRMKVDVQGAQTAVANAKERFDEATAAKQEADQALSGVSQRLAELRKAMDDKAAQKLLDQMDQLRRLQDQQREQAIKAHKEHGARHQDYVTLSSRLDQLKVDLARSEEQLVVERQTYMQKAGIGLAELSGIEAAYDDPNVDLETITGRRKNTAPQLERTVERVSQGCVALAPNRALVYDEATNTVRESTSGETLERLLSSLQRETDTKRKNNTQRMAELTRQQIVVPIVVGMKNDLDDLDRLLSNMNKVLKQTEVNGRHYVIRKRKADGADQTLLSLIDKYSDANQEPVLEAIKQRLQDPRASITDLFDYRQWYDFHLKRVRTDTDGEDAADDVALLSNHMEKGSGGAQAMPHYVLVYVLMRVFYDTVGSRVNLILLDEAFRGIDAGHQQLLIEAGKNLGLTLLTANTELRGHETRRDASTTQLFKQDTDTYYTQIKAIIQHP